MTSKVVLCELLGVLCLVAANVCSIDLYTQLKHGIAGYVVVLRRKLNTHVKRLNEAQFTQHAWHRVDNKQQQQQFER